MNILIASLIIKLAFVLFCAWKRHRSLLDLNVLSTIALFLYLPVDYSNTGHPVDVLSTGKYDFPWNAYRYGGTIIWTDIPFEAICLDIMCAVLGFAAYLYALNRQYESDLESDEALANTPLSNKPVR